MDRWAWLWPAGRLLHTPSFEHNGCIEKPDDYSIVIVLTVRAHFRSIYMTHLITCRYVFWKHTNINLAI